MARRVSGFTPAGNPDGWRRVGPLVRELVSRAEPATPYTAGELLTAVGRLALFADGEGLPPRADVWWDDALIERFLAVGCNGLKASTRGNYRSRLVKVRSAISVAGIGPVDRAPLCGSDPRDPYTPAEVAALWSWRGSLPEGGPRENVGALMAAGLGCGLASEDLIPSRGVDVRVAPNGAAAIAVPGRRPRLTVCRAEWETVLAGAAVRAGENFLFRPGRTTCGRNTVTNYVDKLRRPEACPLLSTQRCRATWIVHHLSVRTPVPVLAAAAGVETLHALSRYLPFVPELSADEAAAYLRGRR